MDAVAILGLAGLLFVKEAGVPVPVPGDLLVLGAGVAAAGDPLIGAVALVAILLAGFAGGCLQFLLTRGAFRKVLVDLLVRIGLSRARLDALTEWLRGRGARGVAVSRATPGVRVGAIAASGLAALPMPVFLPGLVAGNTVFVGGHFLLGYLIGPGAIGLIAGSGSIAVAILVVVVLAVLGAIGWSMLRRRRASAAASAASTGSAAPSLDAGASPYGSWADAACPACLAIAILRPVRADEQRARAA
jgi:membrane protein DedA with SNARE-associated domain